MSGMVARRDRDAIVLAVVDDDVTGKYDGDELRSMRSKRPTAARLTKLEEKHDELGKAVAAIQINGAAMSGKLDALLDLSARAEQARQHQATIDAAKEAGDVAGSRSHTVSVIKTLGVALALIAAAVVGHGV